MKLFHTLLLAWALMGALASATPARADNDDPLFVNLTSEEKHRSDMAMMFSKSMMERGHPLTIWLNDQAVVIAAKKHGDRFADQQKTLADLIAKGATVIACPVCMKHYGVEESDLLSGVKVGNPDLTDSLLFKDDTRTLSW